MAQDGINRPVKFIIGTDAFGKCLTDQLVPHLQSLNIEVEEIGVGPYYSVGAELGRRVASAKSSDSKVETLGLVACGTGVGVQIFANKIPGVYAATCLTPEDAVNTRSINNANVLAVSGFSTSPEIAIKILHAFINTPFKAPCPASGGKDWDPDIQKFLDDSLSEMEKIGTKTSVHQSG